MNTPKTLMEAIAFFSNSDNAFDYSVPMRWPNGVACPRYGCVKVSFLSTRRIWKCKGGKEQVSAKVGMIFEDSALDLSKWMVGI